MTSCAGCSLGSSIATQSGGDAFSRAAIAAADVPIRNVPAGTQTCSIPQASVRASPESRPSDGTGVGPIEAAAALARALGDAVATAVAAGVEVDVGATDGAALAFEGEATDPASPQPATRAAARSSVAATGPMREARSPDVQGDHRLMLPSTDSRPPAGEPGDRAMTKIGYAAMLEQFHPTDLLD